MIMLTRDARPAPPPYPVGPALRRRHSATKVASSTAESSPTDEPCYKHSMPVVAKIPVRMTVDEFLQWDSGDGLSNGCSFGGRRGGAGLALLIGALAAISARGRRRLRRRG